jgi:hypothetical protein
VPMEAVNNISLPELLLAEVRSAAQAEHRSVDEVLIDRRSFVDEVAGLWRGAGEGARRQRVRHRPADCRIPSRAAQPLSLTGQ